MHIRMKRFFLAPFALTCFLQAPCLIHAQSDRGRIIGVAYNPSGAIVAGATVRVLNPQTEAVRETVTDENGFYIVDSLLPASYNVVGSLSGFGELTVSAGRSPKSRSVTPAANRASRSHRLQKL